MLGSKIVSLNVHDYFSVALHILSWSWCLNMVKPTGAWLGVNGKHVILIHWIFSQEIVNTSVEILIFLTDLSHFPVGYFTLYKMYFLKKMF